MFKVLTQRERLAELQKRNKELESENANLKAITEYIALCDYPEVFEDEEEGERND